MIASPGPSAMVGLQAGAAAVVCIRVVWNENNDRRESDSVSKASELVVTWVRLAPSKSAVVMHQRSSPFETVVGRLPIVRRSVIVVVVAAFSIGRGV